MEREVEGWREGERREDWGDPGGRPQEPAGQMEHSFWQSSERVGLGYNRKDWKESWHRMNQRRASWDCRSGWRVGRESGDGPGIWQQ